MTDQMRSISAGVLTTVLLCALILFAAFPDLHKRALDVAGQITEPLPPDLETVQVPENRESMLEAIEKNTAMLPEDSKMPGQLRIAVPEGDGNINVENDYVNRVLHISLKGAKEDYFDTDPPVGTVEHIRNIYFEYQKGEARIDVNLDSIYEAQTIRQDGYLYISFVEPRKLYDRIVVIDPGHGGRDKGAGEWSRPEKDINLNIVLRMKELFDESDADIGVYYTRLSDREVSVYDRAALAEELSADLFLSVHNNSLSDKGNTSVNGTEVMYKTTDETGASAVFANRVLDHLTEALGTRRIGIISGDNIHVVRTAEMPVALAEIGFMTNPAELQKLLDPEFQEKAARALYEAVMETVEEMDREPETP